MKPERSLEYAVDRMTDQDLLDEEAALRRASERYDRIVKEIAKRTPDATERDLRE